VIVPILAFLGACYSDDTSKQRAGALAGADEAMFPAVEIVQDAGAAFLCLIGTHEVWVPLGEIRYGSELAQPGDRGRLIVSRWFARTLLQTVCASCGSAIHAEVTSARPLDPITTTTTTSATCTACRDGRGRVAPIVRKKDDHAGGGRARTNTRSRTASHDGLRQADAPRVRLRS
jgi:hypothetical protein